MTEQRLAFRTARYLMLARSEETGPEARRLAPLLNTALAALPDTGRSTWLRSSEYAARQLAAGADLDTRLLDTLDDPALRAFLTDALKLPEDPRVLLVRQDPFEATDIDMLQPEAYGGVRYPPAPYYPTWDTAKLEADMRTLVRTTLLRRKRYALSHPDEPVWQPLNRLVAAGLAVYDDAQIKTIVPDPRLRAALAMLVGTPGRKGIDAVRAGVFKDLIWKTPPGLANAVASSELNTDDTHTVCFNPIFQHEDPRELAATMAHEALHQGFVLTYGDQKNPEEAVANTLENLVRAQFWREDAKLALQQTQLIQWGNTEVMALVNSRDQNGQVNEYGSGKDIFPGKPAWGTSFIIDFVPYKIPSLPGHQTLFDTLGVLTGLRPRALLARLQAEDPSVTEPTLIQFDDNTIALIDEFMGPRVIPPAATLRTALALKLKVPLTALRLH